MLKNHVPYPNYHKNLNINLIIALVGAFGPSDPKKTGNNR